MCCLWQERPDDQSERCRAWAKFSCLPWKRWWSWEVAIPSYRHFSALALCTSLDFWAWPQFKSLETVWWWSWQLTLVKSRADRNLQLVSIASILLDHQEFMSVWIMLSGNSRTQHQKVQRCGVGGTNMNRRCRRYKKVKEVKGVQRCKGGVGGTKMFLGSKNVT